MRVFTRFLSIVSVTLFIPSLVLAFLGADSVKHSSTLQLTSAGMKCLVAGVAVLFIRFFGAAHQRKASDMRRKSRFLR